MLKYFVRTTGERTLDESFSQIDYELLIDKHHNTKLSFAEQLEYLATLQCDCVILEDDVILCRQFKSKIKTVIDNHKTDVINFFFNPNVYIKPRYIGSFFWNQCVYYPKEIIQLLAKEFRQFYEKYPNLHHDLIEGMIFGKYKIRNYLYRPCLVQHLDFDSLIGNKVGNRTTPYFDDYLEDLNIDYKDAFNHKQKLINYRDHYLGEYKKCQK